MGYRLRIGGWSVSVGVITGIAVVLLVGGGAVYARLGGSFGTASGSIDLQKGLIGWWKMDGNAKDATPYARDGSITNAVLAADRKNAPNGAYSFSGASSYMSVGTMPSLTSGSDFSVSFWAKTGAQNLQSVFSQGIPSGWSTYLFIIYFGDSSSAGGLRVWWGGGSRITYTTSVVNTGWRHVTFTRSGTTLNLYLDGQLVGSGTANIDWASTSTSVGAANNNGTMQQLLNGSVDDLRVYNRAVSTDEITALSRQYGAQTNLGGGEKGLVGWWKLNGNAKDYTPYNGGGTVFNGATPTADRKGIANGAYAFNGTNQYISLPANTNLIVGQPALTVSAWINPSALSGTSAVFSRNGPYLLWIDGTNKRLYTGLLVGGTWYWAYSATNSLSINQWQHIAMTYDGTSRRLFINGVQSGLTDTQVAGNIATNNPTTTIGMDPAVGGRYYFSGSIAEVRVYNRALSSQEVAYQASAYNSQVNLNASPTSATSSGNINAGLVGYWPFNGNAKDATPFSNNGTLSNATLADDRRARANSSYALTGASGSWISFGNASNLQQNNLTLSAWVKTTTTTAAYYGIVVKQLAYGMFDYAGHLAIYDWSTSTKRESTATIADGNWHLVTVTIQSGAASGTILYVDGTARLTTTMTVNGQSNPLAVGSGSPTGAGQNLAGSVDDVRIYNRTLSAAEVSTLYNSYQ